MRSSNTAARSFSERNEPEPIRLFRSRLAQFGESDVDGLKQALWALLSDVRWLTSYTADWIAAARRDPLFTPSYRAATGPFHSSAIVIEHRLATVSVNAINPDALRQRKRMNGGRGSIFFPGRQSYLRFLTSGGLRMSYWEIDGEPDCGEGDAALRCCCIGSDSVSTNQPMAFDMARRSYVFEGASESAIFLHGELRAGGISLAREFDAVTGRLIGSSAGSETWSRVQMMLSFLRSVDRRDAADVFRATIAEAPFFVRWHAMREWLALDPRSAWPVLIEMADDDPHPEIGASARAVIARHGAAYGDGKPAACP